MRSALHIRIRTAPRSRVTAVTDAGIEIDIPGITVTVDGGKCEVSPVLYHEEKTAHCGECSPERDTMEEMLLKNAMQLDKPILGIIKDAVREAAPECIKPILQRQQRCKDALGIACIAFAET